MEFLGKGCVFLGRKCTRACSWIYDKEIHFPAAFLYYNGEKTFLWKDWRSVKNKLAGRQKIVSKDGCAL